MKKKFGQKKHSNNQQEGKNIPQILNALPMFFNLFL